MPSQNGHHTISEQKAEELLTGEPFAIGYRPSMAAAALAGITDGTRYSQVLRDVEAMLVHPHVANSLNQFRAGLAPTQIEVKASSPKVEEYVRQEFARFWMFRPLVQLGYEYGWIGLETNYAVRDGLLRFDSFDSFHPLDSFALTDQHRYVGVRIKNVEGIGSIDLWGAGKLRGSFERSEKQRALPTWHADSLARESPTDEVWAAKTSFTMPAKTFWYPHRRRFNAWYGRTQFLAANRPWRRLASIDGAESVIDGGFYRFAYGGPTIYYPPDDQVPRPPVHGNQGTMESNRDKARNLVENAKAGVSIAFPNKSDEHGNKLWELNWPDRSFPIEGLMPYIKYLKDEISYGIGTPPELMEASETGSGYSGRKVPLEAFYGTQQELAETIVVVEWFSQIAEPSVHWNFGPDAWFTIKVLPILASQSAQAQGQQQGQQPGQGQGQQSGQAAGAMGGGGALDNSNPLASLLGGGQGRATGQQQLATQPATEASDAPEQIEEPPPQSAPTKRLATDGGWTPFKGPKGGKGWKSAETGEIRYQNARPGSAAGLHQNFPQIVTADNSAHNHIWVDVSKHPGLAKKLKGLGAQPSASKPGLFRASHDVAAKLHELLAAHLGGAEQGTESKPPSASEATKPEKSEAKAPELSSATAKEFVDHLSNLTGLHVGHIRQALSSDASIKEPHAAKRRAMIEEAILKHGLHQQDAAVKLFAEYHSAEASRDLAASKASGDKNKAAKEYESTPLYDLQILSTIEIHPIALSGQAVCNMATRSVRYGTTSATGDYRHELGHAIHAYLLGGGLDQAIKDHYDGVKKRIAANPTGKNAKLTHEWYEENYGVIGRRGIDNDKEDFAEHYRGYHRELFRDRESGGNAHLDAYRKRHPEMARIFDARYTAALLGAMAAKGAW